MGYNILFEEDEIYHVYNRANGSDLLFFEDRNYPYFLKQYYKFCSPYLNTLAYCLLPNHFHLLIKVKVDIDMDGLHESFRKFFISYSKAINKQEKRKGSLFMKPFKRKKIDSNEYLSNIISYIHLNPWHHNKDTNYEDYPWSSYQLYLTDHKTNIDCQPILDWFGSIEAFKEFHQSAEVFDLENNLYLE